MQLRIMCNTVFEAEKIDQIIKQLKISLRKVKWQNDKKYLEMESKYDNLVVALRDKKKIIIINRKIKRF